jgi:hypothetical protein
MSILGRHSGMQQTAKPADAGPESRDDDQHLGIPGSVTADAVRAPE